MPKNEIEMTKGPMLKNFIRFALPLIFANVLQTTFSLVDSAVVGQFSGSDAVGAIGATLKLTNLVLALFIGLSAGVSICVSHSLGLGDKDSCRRHSHNAIATALVSGVVVGIFALFLARWALTKMSTPAGVILEGAITYFRIYFIGAPVLLLYNFGSALLRANGDTKTPFKYLCIGGVFHIILNLILVAGFKLDVAGAAIATVSANALSAFLVIRSLTKVDNWCRIDFKEVKVYKKELIAIAKFGIPSGLQSCMFHIPNLYVQPAINSFGAAALKGDSAATNVATYLDVCNSALAETALTFIARNFGSKNSKRILKVLLMSLIITISINFVLSTSAYIFRVPLLSIFIPGDIEAIAFGSIRLLFLALPNFLGASMNCLTSALRGIGKPTTSMLISIFGVCIIRILWFEFLFPIPDFHNIYWVYFTYPMTWFITDVLLTIFFIYYYKKLKKSFSEQNA